MNKETQTVQSKRERRQTERQRQREAEQARVARRRRILISVISVIAALIVANITFFVARAMQNQPSQPSAPSSTTASNASSPYAPVDGIPCESSEQLNYHIHAHLTLYINGNKTALPAEIGIASDNSCIYWLHTHDTTGVIHIEAPSQRSFTLGTFFHIWGQRFQTLQYPSQLDQTQGWQAYVNGKPYNGDFHAIPLDAHAVITLAYNSPGITPDTNFDWQGL